MDETSSPTPGIQPPPADPVKATELVVANDKRANEVVLMEKDVEAADGRFAVTRTVPAELPWRRLIVRATAATAHDSALGVLRVKVSAIHQAIILSGQRP